MNTFLLIIVVMSVLYLLLLIGQKIQLIELDKRWDKFLFEVEKYTKQNYNPQMRDLLIVKVKELAKINRVKLSQIQAEVIADYMISLGGDN